MPSRHEDVERSSHGPKIASNSIPGSEDGGWPHLKSLMVAEDKMTKVAGCIIGHSGSTGDAHSLFAVVKPAPCLCRWAKWWLFERRHSHLDWSAPPPPA